MKIGDIITCKSNYAVEHDISVGLKYKIEAIESDGSIRIINDGGRYHSFSLPWFRDRFVMDPVTVLNAMSAEIHGAQVQKGFWEQERSFGELLMLVTSELSEALEANRKANKFTEFRKKMFAETDISGDQDFKSAFELLIKDTEEDEIADAIIRLMDLAGNRGYDLDFHIKQKLRYNSLRPHKHGKLY